MRHFPAFFDLAGQPVLLVGGGEAAARKARLLIKAGARITLVAPRAGDELRALAADGTIAWRDRPFAAADAAAPGAKALLVVSATGLDEVDRAVSEAARAAGLPVNVVDRPELSSFITPAIVERDPIVIGISTAGTAPVLARRLRAQIEALLPSRLGALARFAERFRGAVAATVSEPVARKRFWERFFDGPVAARVLAGDERGASERMLALVNGPAARGLTRGTARQRGEGIVHIVGAGPGDPDLLTLRALRLIQDAEVIFHDKLVAPEILDAARRDAERVYVGKTKGNHAKTQDQINALMAGAALTGKRVVRLKGGDPFVFGRGGEEAAYLRQRGVAVAVVPGITAATGCAAAADIPLTYRGLAQAVTFVTGHAADGEPDLDWAALAKGRQTLAIYMGVSTAGTIARRLIEAGAEPGRPAAIIENGTRADQRVVSGRLADLESLVVRHAIKGPALIVVGEVVALAGASVLPALAASSMPRAANA
jgi:uroporphyrin-III C-methyltransferase/precorrin-2 dehydrogenase/sirohydrochlorin ferrochelatase